MLTVKTEKGFVPLENRFNFIITTQYEGEQSLSFDLKPSDPYFTYIHEESLLHFEENDYLVKSINQRKDLTTIEATLNLDDWKSKVYQEFKYDHKLFFEIVEIMIPHGWIVEGAGSVTHRADFDMKGCSNYEILMECKKLYNIVFEYHTASKKIIIVQPELVQTRGLYMTDELNLQNLEFKGTSASLMTRIYAYGKKVDIKNEDGEVVGSTYVDFKSINDGKDYVDNHTYCDKVLSAYWQDDKIEDPQELLNLAIEKLKTVALPARSYACKLVDLSRTNPKYKMLDFKLYDKTMLIDHFSKAYVAHQIVQYKRYPDNEQLNEITLSSVFKNITGTIDGIKQTIASIDQDIKSSENSLNEIIRDVESNTFRIENTYSKGDTDVLLGNVIQQTSTSIDMAITDIEKNEEEIKQTVEDIHISIDGIRNQMTTTGGNNIFEDTMGVFNDRFSYDSNVWEGTFNIDASTDAKNRNIYGYALLLKSGTIHQTQRVPNGLYTVSFQYRKHIDLASVKVLINGRETALISDDYTKIEIFVEVTTNALDISFISDTDNACTVINLMGNQGESASVWSLAPGESWNDYVKIGRGIEIGSDASEVTFNANADIIGFKNKSGEYVAVFTDTGADMKEIVVKDKAKIIGLLFQRINGQTVINHLGVE